MNFIRGMFQNKRADDLINSSHILQLNYEAALLREAELKAKLSRFDRKRDAHGRFVREDPPTVVKCDLTEISTGKTKFKHGDLSADLHHEQPDPREGWSPWLSNEDNVTGECPIPLAGGRIYECYFPNWGSAHFLSIGAVNLLWSPDINDRITRYRYRLDAMPVDKNG